MRGPHVAGRVGQGLEGWAIELWCAGAKWSCGHEWLEAPREIPSLVGGGDAPRERAMFWLFDAVGGLLDGEKRLLERGDPVGDRLVCDACRVWSPLVRDLSEGGDEFAYFYCVDARYVKGGQQFRQTCEEQLYFVERRRANEL